LPSSNWSSTLNNIFFGDPVSSDEDFTNCNMRVHQYARILEYFLFLFLCMRYEHHDECVQQHKIFPQALHASKLMN